jgi:RNA polymerase sigma-70 factor (ECF subfamily)
LGRVYTLLEHLPVDARIAWTLRQVEGEQLEAVAAICGCSLATAKRRIGAVQAKIDEVLGHE